MPKYIPNALHRLQLALPKRLQHTPHRHTKTIYGQKVQYAEEQVESDVVYLPESATKIIQKIIGIFLYYGLGINLAMLVELVILASQKSQPTEELWNDIIWFLNYAATHPDAKICFLKSNMILYVASDGSYLSETKERSRVGGIFYLSSKIPPTSRQPAEDHPFNAPIHAVAKI